MEHDPGRLLSFGSSPDRWEYRFELSPLGERTGVEFARRFRSLSLRETLFGGDDGTQRLAEKTLAVLADACCRLAAGVKDGIFRHK